MNKKIKKELKKLAMTARIRQSIIDCSIETSLLEWVIIPITLKVEISITYVLIKAQYRWIPKFYNLIKK